MSQLMTLLCVNKPFVNKATDNGFRPWALGAVRWGLNISAGRVTWLASLGISAGAVMESVMMLATDEVCH